MAYTTTQEPYVRTTAPADKESTDLYLFEELRKIELTLSRIKEILDKIDTRLTTGGL